MKLKAKHKVYGLVLTLAGAAFCADRLFFSPAVADGATQAIAPRAAMAQPAAVVQPSVSSAVEAQPASTGWLAARLRAVPAGSDNDLRDVFSPSTNWRPALKAVEPAAPLRPPLMGDRFCREHHVTAVVIDAKGGHAVVNGQLMAVGVSVDGFRLIEITRKSVRFADAYQQVSLPLNDASVAEVR